MSDYPQLPFALLLTQATELYTNNHLFRYIVDSLWTQRGNMSVPIYSMSYHNDYLHECSIPSLALDGISPAIFPSFAFNVKYLSVILKTLYPHCDRQFRLARSTMARHQSSSSLRRHMVHSTAWNLSPVYTQVLVTISLRQCCKITLYLYSIK